MACIWTLQQQQSTVSLVHSFTFLFIMNVLHSRHFTVVILFEFGFSRNVCVRESKCSFYFNMLRGPTLLTTNRIGGHEKAFFHKNHFYSLKQRKTFILCCCSFNASEKHVLTFKHYFSSFASYENHLTRKMKSSLWL